MELYLQKNWLKIVNWYNILKCEIFKYFIILNIDTIHHWVRLVNQTTFGSFLRVIPQNFIEPI